jgi:hypothetical protein
MSWAIHKKIRRGGRPQKPSASTVYSAQVARICDRLVEGESLRAICSDGEGFDGAMKPMMLVSSSRLFVGAKKTAHPGRVIDEVIDLVGELHFGQHVREGLALGSVVRGARPQASRSAR